MNKILCFMGLFCAVFTVKAQCDGTLPINEGFNSISTINSCWTFLDNDNDGNNWYIENLGGNPGLVSASWTPATGPLTPDNWVITNAIDLRSFSSSSSIQIRWKVRTPDWSFDKERYSVYVATGNQISNFLASSVTMFDDLDNSDAAGLNYATRNLNISSLAGNIVYVAIRHYNSTDQNEINIDDFEIFSGSSSGGGGNNCIQSSANFSSNSLSHLGSGSKSTTLVLPNLGENISFTVGDIDERTKGKESSKYIENVTISYKDGLGVSRIYRSYSGLNVSSADVNILDKVQSITVTLEDIYSGNSDSNLSVSLSSVSYCNIGSAPPPCTDSDGDTICDTLDQCPGKDDRIDVNNNGIPDGCESGCVQSSLNFTKNPLTHSGSGSNSTTLNLPTNSEDVVFTISGLDDKLKGKESNKYVEKVTVTYKDGLGLTKTHGTFNGSNIGSTLVDIKGKVQSITVSLTDGQNGNTTSTMSVDLSSVTFCSTSTARTSGELNTGKTSNSISDEPIESSIKVYPNPASDALYVKSISNEGSSNILLYNINGTLVLGAKIDNSSNKGQKIDIQKIPTGLYLLRIVNNNGDVIKTERIVIN
ncbi:choice-of-anchor J domain-containing protein [Geojedonia litorea]|uniref:Choice-of-anchor J domain-containing protein n=1 Tax=Geojedonia litorea TaxID=1268269 RepID=A0ABV9N5J1_9FLAO